MIHPSVSGKYTSSSSNSSSDSNSQGYTAWQRSGIAVRLARYKRVLCECTCALAAGSARTLHSPLLSRYSPAALARARSPAPAISLGDFCCCSCWRSSAVRLRKDRPRAQGQRNGWEKDGRTFSSLLRARVFLAAALSTCIYLYHILSPLLLSSLYPLTGHRARTHDELLSLLPSSPLPWDSILHIVLGTRFFSPLLSISGLFLPQEVPGRCCAFRFDDSDVYLPSLRNPARAKKFQPLKCILSPRPPTPAFPQSMCSASPCLSSQLLYGTRRVFRICVHTCTLTTKRLLARYILSLSYLLLFTPRHLQLSMHFFHFNAISPLIFRVAKEMCTVRKKQWYNEAIRV